MRLFVAQFKGVWLTGYGLICASDPNSAKSQIMEYGIDGFEPESNDWLEVIDVTDRLRKNGDTFLIWDGNY
jgi:hypothetical protein